MSSQEVEIVQDNLTQLVRCGMAGDREALPAIRELFDQTPVRWKNASSLADQVERRWLQVVSGTDLVTREILTHQMAVLKSQIAGPTPTPLEQLLADRIVVCWLQVQQAELRAANRLSKNGWVLSNAEENRLDKVNRRFLAAVKNLAQIRKLLRPGASVQVNIAQQQVNMA
jgi:hypothetical protein